jgi:hypothetical protein
MEYRFKCDVKALDLWKMAMTRTYKSIVGLVNVIFTIAMILLTIRFWAETSDLFRVLMVLGCILFPIIQPLAIYGNSVKQLENLPRDMELLFNEGGVRVFVGDKSELLRWNRIKNAIRRNNMIVVMSDDSHGYMLTNRVLGDQKEEFYQYICKKIRG